jgi:hypothetical protein
MRPAAGFLVEEFLDAVSAQLDRTQDALAAKAQVRPMTFALRSFEIDLQVFVTMDGEGNVRLRSADAGETGASSLKLDFATITRAMAQENTVSLANAQAPSLGEAGLAPQEARQLERLGVRTVAQLQTLRASGAGIDGISRLTDRNVPADRLREALRLSRPQLFAVSPAAPAPAPQSQPAAEPVVVRLAPGTRRIALAGRNFLSDGGPPAVRLDGALLTPVAAADDRVELDLPRGSRGGALEIDLGEDGPAHYAIEIADGNGRHADAWTPEEVR